MSSEGSGDPFAGDPVFGASFAVSVVIPTRNEAANVAALVNRVSRVAPDRPLEIVVVDDSDDHTPYVVKEVAAEAVRDVKLIARAAGARPGGLGGAVQAGIRIARSPWVCVMGADLEDPPETIPQLIYRARETAADLVVGASYPSRIDRADGARRVQARAISGLARLFLGTRLDEISDPLSGFFLVRKAAISAESLRPRGHRILLEIVARNPALRIVEFPYIADERSAGTSKAGLVEGAKDALQLVALRLLPPTSPEFASHNSSSQSAARDATTTIPRALHATAEMPAWSVLRPSEAPE